MVKAKVKQDIGAVEHILLVKLDAIGDFILVTPFLRGLRTSAPDATIVLAVSPLVADLAAACPHIDAVVAVHPNQVTGAFDLRISNPAHMYRLQQVMRQGGFDLAVVPRFDFDRFRGGWLAKSSGARRVVGFSEIVTPMKAQYNLGFDAQFYTDVLVRSAAAHEVEQNLALLAHIGGKAEGQFVEAYSTPDAVAAAERIIAMAIETLHEERFITVAPGASDPAREYPPPQLASVIRAVAERLCAGVLVLGSAPQAGLGETVRDLLHGGCVNLCGRLTVPEAADVIRRSLALISMDSGPAHIAAAVGTPVIVFSCHPRNGNPEHFQAPERFRPWTTSDKALVLQPEKAVGSCQGTCLAQEPHCIATIDADRAANEVVVFFLEHGDAQE